jgi:hypothetical protein
MWLAPLLETVSSVLHFREPRYEVREACCPAVRSAARVDPRRRTLGRWRCHELVPPLLKTLPRCSRNSKDCHPWSFLRCGSTSAIRSCVSRLLDHRFVAYYGEAWDACCTVCANGARPAPVAATPIRIRVVAASHAALEERDQLLRVSLAGRDQRVIISPTRGVIHDGAAERLAHVAVSSSLIVACRTAAWSSFALHPLGGSVDGRHHSGRSRVPLLSGEFAGSDTSMVSMSAGCRMRPHARTERRPRIAGRWSYVVRCFLARAW